MHPRMGGVAGRMVLVLGLVGALPPTVAAQGTGQITGRVVAESTGRPVPGALVLVETLRLGSVTDQDGRYAIQNVPVGSHSIAVEVLGYASSNRQVTVTLNATATADFSMRETAIALERVVVTGTAAETRAREVGNSIDQVTSQEIRNLPILNAETALSGRIAGLAVIQAGGQVGSGGTMRIRGQTTVSQTYEPLIYVDGVRLYNLPVDLGGTVNVAATPLQDIAAEDIDRIEVIKGASATTLYGTEAAGGVIQIFTKRGIAGEPIWSADLSLGLASQGHVGPKDDPSELFTTCGGELYGFRASGSQMGERQDFEDPTCPASGSWFRTAQQLRYAMSVRGGTSTVGYYVSGSFSNNEGTVQTQDSKDGSLRGNLDFEPLSNLRISLNTAYSRRFSHFVEDGNNANGFLLNIGRGTNTNYTGGKEDDCANVTVLCVTNGYILDTENAAATDRYTTGLVVAYSPIASLSNRLAIGWDYFKATYENWRPWGDLDEPGGSFLSADQARTKLSIDYAGSLRNTLSDDLISTLSWGGQIFRDEARRKSVSTQDFAGPGKPNLEAGGGEINIDDAELNATNAGFFLQELLGVRDRLFLTGGLRVDGNSAFGDDFGLQAYPKLSVSYILSDAEFWPTEWFETLKLRAALGESGKAPGAFDKLRTWTPVTGDESTAGFTPGDIGNDEVGPERTRELELGFDASLLAGRFGLEATYYNTKTSDALVPVIYSPSLGFLSARTENVGEVTGNGLEFQLYASPIRTPTFEWRLTANIGFNNTEAVDLDRQQLDVDNLAGIREGDPFPANYGAKITNPDAFEDPVIEEDAYLGPVNPTRVIGLSTAFHLGDHVLLEGLLEHQGGHTLPNYTGYQNARRGVWQPCYEIYPKLIAQDNGDESAVADVTALERARCRLNGIGGHDAAYFVEKADFWKLRQIALTFDLPAQLIARFADRGSVTLAASNLFLWTDYTGLDPELEDFGDRSETGIYDGATDYGRREYYQFPAPRTFLLSLRFTF